MQANMAPAHTPNINGNINGVTSGHVEGDDGEGEVNEKSMRLRVCIIFLSRKFGDTEEMLKTLTNKKNRMILCCLYFIRFGHFQEYLCSRLVLLNSHLLRPQKG